MTERQLLDTDMMHSLKELLAENFELLVNTFVTDGSARMTRLREGVERCDFSMVRMEAHALKGSSRNVGAEHFAGLCSEVENQARDNDGTDLQERFLTIESEFKLLCIEVKKFL